MTPVGRLMMRLERIGRFVEDFALVALLGMMIILAGAQIILRNVFDTGFIWADELLRIMVLWVALLGAVAASRDDKHINIDVLSRFLSPRPKLVVRTIVALFTGIVCGLIGWYSALFVHGSYVWGDKVLGDLPAWPFQLILPLAFTAIAFRYLLFAAKRLRALLTGKQQP